MAGTLTLVAGWSSADEGAAAGPPAVADHPMSTPTSITDSSAPPPGQGSLPGAVDGDGTYVPVALERTRAALEQAGYVIVASDDLTGTPPEQPAVFDYQLTVWATEVDVRGGVGGRELAERFPLPPELPQMDAFVAGWLRSATSPAADGARTLVDVSQLADPAEFVYPWAVIAAFSNDVISGTIDDPDEFEAPAASVPSADSVVAPPSSSPPTVQPFGSLAGRQRTTVARAPQPGVRAAVADFNPCGAILAFKGATLGKIQAWGDAEDDNKVRAAARAAVSMVATGVSVAIDALVEAYLGPVKAVLAVMAIASAIAAVITPWTTTMETLPAELAFGVEPGPASVGQFRIRVYAPVPDWPDAVRDCAALVGTTLPYINAEGAPVEWTFEGYGKATSTAMEAAMVPINTFEAVATLSYTTGTETAEMAERGLRLEQPIWGAATVHRNGVAELGNLLSSLLAEKLDALGSDGGLLLADQAGEAMTGLIDLQTADSDGRHAVVVFHDAPPPPTTLPPPGCLDRSLYSVAAPTGNPQFPTAPAGAGLTLNSDGSGFMDLDSSQPFDGPQGAVLRFSGILPFTWAGDPAGQMQLSNFAGEVIGSGTLNGVTISLPADAFGGVVASDATITCDVASGTVTMTRPDATWVFAPGPDPNTVVPTD